jgi:hypothetical protein
MKEATAATINTLNTKAISNARRGLDIDVAIYNAALDSGFIQSKRIGPNVLFDDGQQTIWASLVGATVLDLTEGRAGFGKQWTPASILG